MEMRRESIFKTIIRAFCKVFFSVVAFFVAIAVGMSVINIATKPVEVSDSAKPVTAYNAEGKKELLDATSPVILLINIQGIVGDIKLNAKNIISKLNDSQTLPVLKDRIKAIFLHVNTPGGTVTDSDGIYSALLEYKEKYKVPIYAFVDGLCASGGMYIASATDKIFATSTSIIGSVGVYIGPNFNIYELMEKIGIKSETLTAGKYKNFTNPFKPWTEDQLDPLKPIVSYYYTRFVDIVTRGRPQINKIKLVQDYGANIFYAEKAEELGYIDDANSSYSKALAALVEASGIKKDEKYQVIELKAPTKIFSDIIEGNSLLSGKIKHIFKYPGHEFAPLSNQFLYLYQPNP